jgi:hypothetical protein
MHWSGFNLFRRCKYSGALAVYVNVAYVYMPFPPLKLDVLRCVGGQLCIRRYVFMYVCVCVCIYIYIYIYIADMTCKHVLFCNYRKLESTNFGDI